MDLIGLVARTSQESLCICSDFALKFLVFENSLADVNIVRGFLNISLDFLLLCLICTMFCSVCAAPQAPWQEACMNEHDKK